MFDNSSEEVTKAEYVLYANDKEISSKFSTTEPGEYVVYAMANGIKSNEIKITVTKIPSIASKVLIVTDKDSILANGMDKVTFTVNVYDQYDEIIDGLTSRIYIDEERLTGNEFSTKDVGEYKVYATHGDIKSNVITLKAEYDPIKPSKIVVTASKTTIIANGEDSTVFTATIYDQYNEKLEDVTYQLYIDDELFDGSNFKTETAKNYIVYASVGDVKSEEIKIVAEHATYNGNFYVESGMTQEYLDSIGRITGNLYCDDDVENFEMKNLKTIDGGIYCNGLYFLESISLPNLETINKTSSTIKIDDADRSISIGLVNCYALHTIDMPKLKSTQGQIFLKGNSELDTMNFDSLVSAGTFTVRGNKFKNIRIDNLTNLIQLAINDELTLESVEFESLTNITYGVYFYNNPNLKTIIANSLTSTGERMNIYDNTKLENIQFKGLKTINEHLLLLNLNSLTSISFDSLEKITGKGNRYHLFTGGGSYYENYHYISLEINSCNSLEEVSFPSLESLNESINISDNPLLNRLTIPKLQTIGTSLYITNNGLTEINMPALTSVKRLFRIFNENKLTTIEFPSLNEITSFTQIYNNTLLETILFDKLTTTKDRVSIYDNAELKTILFNKLVSAKERIEIYDNPTLHTIKMNSLITIDNLFRLNNLPKLTTLEMEKLKSINNSTYLYGLFTGGGSYYENYHYISLEINQCNSLEVLSLPSVTSFSAGFYIRNNTKLHTISMPVINSTGSTPNITNNGLETLDLPNLSVVNRSFFITNEPKITEINLPSLINCKETFKIEKNAELTTINAPQLNQIGKDLYISFVNEGGVVDLADNLTVAGKTTITNGTLE